MTGELTLRPIASLSVVHTQKSRLAFAPYSWLPYLVGLKLIAINTFPPSVYASDPMHECTHTHTRICYMTLVGAYEMNGRVDPD